MDVLEGKPTETVLKYAKRKEADLIVLGKPNRDHRPRLHLGKIAELSSCSVLFVPKGADIRLDEVGVALDFSDQSYQALQQALRIADEGNQRQPPVRVYGLHVYQVPNGFSKTGQELRGVCADHGTQCPRGGEKVLQGTQTLTAAV